MGYAGHDASLLAKSRGESRRHFRHGLDRYLSAKVEIQRAVDHSHTAGANPLLESKLAEKYIRQTGRLQSATASGAAGAAAWLDAMATAALVGKILC
jgi:hypothetical protein